MKNSLKIVSKVLALVVVVNVLGGCAIVTSKKIGVGADETFGDFGIPYMLPKALLPIEVVVNGGLIRIDLLEPVYVGDASQAYALRYESNPFSTDNVRIVVDPATSLLKTLSLESKDETGDVLKKAFATLRAESAVGGGETVVMQAVLDPGDYLSIKSINDEVSKALQDYVDQKRVGCNSVPKSEGCAAIDALPTALSSELTVRLMAPTVPAVTALAAGRSVDCSIGICYRGTMPYQVSLKALGQTRSTLVHLPNHGPVMALPLSGNAFVNTKHTVSLRNGMLESYEINKPSSALAMVAWPLDLFDAVVNTASKIVQLKIDTSRSSMNLQDQLLAEAKKRKEIEDALSRLNAKPESAGLINMGNSRAILTVGAGKPPSVLPLSVKNDVVNPLPAMDAASSTSRRGSGGTLGDK